MTVRPSLAVQIAFCVLLCGESTRLSAAVERFEVDRSPHSLIVEVLNDTLVHFELAENQVRSPLNRPLPASPMIQKRDYTGPNSFRRNGRGFETEALRVSVDTSSLCVDLFDKTAKETLTAICPLNLISSFSPESPREIAGASLIDKPRGLSFSQQKMQSVYGLGEQFVSPGVADGDWIGKIRSSPDPFGNVLFSFEGGAVENAQFPIMYAVGPRKLNYAIFLDHTFRQTWNFQADPWIVETRGDVIRWYFISGKDIPALRTQFMDLVGHPLVPPKKAFGLWVSEFGYRDWAEMENKLKTLREHHFPIDGFVLDLYWYGPFTGDDPDNSFGRLSWDAAHFPGAKAKIARWRDQEGIGLALIEQSYVNANLPEYGLLKDKGYLVKMTGTRAPVSFNSWWGKGSMLDWTNKEAAGFWHDLKRQPLVDDGILIHWTDLGEPETYTDQAEYAGIESVRNRGEAEIHNIYNFKWAEGIYNGYARHGVNRRPFILSRSGAPGIQRFGAAMWSGDIGSNLRSLAAHANAQMHMSFSGVDYFGSDTGGFHREGLEGDLNEVYTRWLAYSSVFDVPVRPHTDNGSKKNDTPPDRIGDVSINLANLRQRYELGPYYYSLAYRAYLYGEPVFPPLVYYDQEDPNVRSLGEEKMIGRDLLAAAAFRNGETSRSVYLPVGVWADYHTHAWYRSPGRWFSDIPEYQDGIFRLPLFARAGAIIPKMRVDDKTMNIMGKRADGSEWNDLMVRVFASTQPSSFTLFEDDGETVEYQRGSVAATEIAQRQWDHKILVSISPVRGRYRNAPKTRVNRVELLTMNDSVDSVLLNGIPLPKLKSPSEFESAQAGWYPSDSHMILAQSGPEPVSELKTFQFLLKK